MPRPAPPLTIPAALRLLGTGYGTEARANPARVFVQTVPLPTLLEALPPLWKQEERKRQRRLKICLALIIIQVIGLFFVFFAANVSHGQLPFDSADFLMVYVPGVSILLPSAISQLLGGISKTQRGIIRLLHLRPCWQMVPLLIDALPLTLKAVEGTPDAARFQVQHRTLLTRYLPLWCEQDTQSLTPRQKKILRSELKRVAHQGVGIHRNIGAPTPPLSDADTNYLLALLTALRRPTSQGMLSLDHKTRTALEHLPQAISATDHNRQHLQEATQAFLSHHQT